MQVIRYLRTNHFFPFGLNEFHFKWLIFPNLATQLLQLAIFLIMVPHTVLSSLFSITLLMQFVGNIIV